MKKLNKIVFDFTIDGKLIGKEFYINKEASSEDAEAIGVVMQKWITNTLKANL